MTFLNWTILIGLTAIAIPILIHLLNRSRARIIDWGAMRFLMASLASRSRRIMIEEVILMALRCLAVALAVLAVARPFLPTRPTLLWMLFLPALVAAAICGSLAAAMWSQRRARAVLLACAVVLAMVPVIVGGLEHAYQKSRWSFGPGEKDVAIVIDASSSMGLKSEGRTNFQRAADEARAIVAACQPGDGITILLAASAPQAVIGSPTANRKEIEAALRDLTSPLGGSMDVHQAIQMASHSLSDGGNPGKKIVLITDGQSVGWDVQKKAQWKFLGTALKGHPTPPHVLVRTLPLPRKIRNASAIDLSLDRRIVGTDREVQIDVKLAGTGTEPTDPTVVKFLVDGEEAGGQQVDRILPGAAETVRFRYRFARPGRHILAARLLAEDDLAEDNAIQRVVDVLAALPVLVVNGSPSVRPLEGASDFIEIALAPPEDPPDRPATRPAESQEATACLMAPKVVAAPDVAAVTDLGQYAAVILADVPRLPQEFARRLEEFVRGGGGLFIAAGPQADPTFYGAWTSPSGPLVSPARLVRLRTLGEKPAKLAADSLSHPALERLADPARSDVRLALVSSYWELAIGQNDADVDVAAALDGGQALLVERKLGKGRVILSATAMHPASCNLPALKCFVPLMHELTCYLAATGLAECNVESGADVAIELRAGRDWPATAPVGRPLAVGDQVEVTTPSQRRRLATVTRAGESLRIAFDQTQEPGLYRLVLPQGVAARHAAMSPDGRGVPFVVVSRSDESNLAQVSDADLEAAREAILSSLDGAEPGKTLIRVETTGELTAAVAGGIPGRELWQLFALVLVGALLAEIALTRWIAIQRKVLTTQTVAFGMEAVDVQAFRRRAREMLAAPQAAAVEGSPER